jgi:hypothetical protein
MTRPSAPESALWKLLWRTPQAAAWISEPWRHETIATYVRWRVRMHDPEAPASIGATVIRLADQIGLTPAGLRENGWELEELPGSRAIAEQAGTEDPPTGVKVPQPPPATPLRSRLKVVKRAGGE